jgi:hypothetical protein
MKHLKHLKHTLATCMYTQYPDLFLQRPDKNTCMTFFFVLFCLFLLHQQWAHARCRSSSNAELSAERSGRRALSVSEWSEWWRHLCSGPTTNSPNQNQRTHDSFVVASFLPTMSFNFKKYYMSLCAFA